MSPDEQKRRHVRQVLFGEGFLEEIVAAANPDRDVTFDWGEPDEDGNYCPVVTTKAKEPVPA